MSAPILGVALRLPDGAVYAKLAPHRHHDCIAALAQAGHPTPIPYDQGFIDADARYLTREEARQRAIATRQCTNPAHPRDLFSEDLW